MTFTDHIFIGYVGQENYQSPILKLLLLNCEFQAKATYERHRKKCKLCNLQKPSKQNPNRC